MLDTWTEQSEVIALQLDALSRASDSVSKGVESFQERGLCVGDRLPFSASSTWGLRTLSPLLTGNRLFALKAIISALWISMAGETTERDPLPFFYSFRRNEKSTRRNLVQEENFSGSGKYVLVLITDVLPDLFFSPLHHFHGGVQWLVCSVPPWNWIKIVTVQ